MSVTIENRKTAAGEVSFKQILVENARRKGSRKRGGQRARVNLDAAEAVLHEPSEAEDLLALDEALDHLAAADADAAVLVKLRYFAGLTLPAAAEALGISPRSADRLWVYARAFLLRALHDE